MRRPSSAPAARSSTLALLLTTVLLVTTAACSPSGGAADPQATARPAAISTASATSAAPQPLPPPTPTSTPSSIPTPTAQTTAAPVLLGTFPVEAAAEVSGIAVSQRTPGVIWLLDDGPGTTSLLAVAADGTMLGSVTMTGVAGRDTEALAIASCGAADPSPCLYVGDIGDNRARRETVAVHRFPEPLPTDVAAQVTTATFSYPQGPVDAEAMLVGADGVPLILTKEAVEARIFRPDGFADGALQQVGTISIPPPRTPLLTLVTGLVLTDAALAPDGTAVLLRTYDHAVLLRAPTAPANPLDMTDWTASEVPVHTERQGEAIAFTTLAFDTAGTAGQPGLPGYLTASEGSGELWFTALS